MHYAIIAVPGGATTIDIDGADVARYNADPDAYAAQHFGLTTAEYDEWIELDGAPLCRCRTASGDFCRRSPGRGQLDAREWKARHRKLTCAFHSGTAAARDGAP